MSNIVAKYTILLHMNNCYSKYVNYEPLVGLRSVVFMLHIDLVVHLTSSVMTKFKLTTCDRNGRSCDRQWLTNKEKRWQANATQHLITMGKH